MSKLFSNFLNKDNDKDKNLSLSKKKPVKKYNEKSKIVFSMETDSNPDRYESNPTTTPDGRSTKNRSGVRLESIPTSFTSPPTVPQNIILGDLPTTDPGIAGVLWNDNGVPKISTGWYL